MWRASVSRADVESIRQRGDAPAQAVRTCPQHAAHRATNEAGMSGDQ